MFGEAVVVSNTKYLHHFTPLIKQHGALLAKGRLLGVQFEALFENGLYWKISHNAIDMAMRLKAGFREHNYEMLIDSPTNQQFVILPNDEYDRLSEKVTFSMWGTRGESSTAARFVTDWGTTAEDVDALISCLK